MPITPLFRSLFLRTALQKEANSGVCNADNAQLPAYSGLQLPVCNAQAVQRANWSELHPESKRAIGLVDCGSRSFVCVQRTVYSRMDSGKRGLPAGKGFF